jgi:hypothetical protein
MQIFATETPQTDDKSKTIEFVARQKGTVVVVWVKNLSQIGSLDSIELGLPEGKIGKFWALEAWNATLTEDGRKLEFHREGSAVMGEMLRLKFIIDAFPSILTWQVIYDGKTQSGTVSVSILRPSESGFPPHEYLYKNGQLINKDTISSIPVLKWIDLKMSSDYPSLKVRDGFEITQAVYGQAGGDILTFIVAKDARKEIGFVVQKGNWTHGTFLFTPLDNEEEALQYLQFMLHATDSSFLGREFREITSVDQYNHIIFDMEKRASSQGREIEFLRNAPTTFTHVEKIDDVYDVERVFLKQTERERLVYSRTTVYANGTTLLNEEYEFVRGVVGVMP